MKHASKQIESKQIGMEKKKMELLAPAGDLEKLKTAVIYGADAVYFGGEDFSLRAGADNFSMEDMREGIRFAHDHGAKCLYDDQYLSAQ